MEKAQDRLHVLKKIEEYEKKGMFNEPVEADPPGLELLPNKIDYTNKKLISKIKTFFANKMGQSFFEGMIKNKAFIIKEVKGLENLTEVKTGAVITCNHFNIFDNYIIYKSLIPYLKKKMLWKVIKEANYTASPKPFGFFFRNCNTLPLSSNKETMKNFLRGVKQLLQKGENILVYPEQEMWWNYKKPRPIKPGAFNFAVGSNVPVIPMFITMEDSTIIGQDGFNVQEYTVHILKPIYPKEELTKPENIEYLKTENYNAWVKVYEEFYNKKLEYLK